MKIKKYVEDYREVIYGDPWFGSGLMKTITEIPYPLAVQKDDGLIHSICELVIHMINWRNYGIEKIKGNEVYSIELNSAMDWPKFESINESHWVVLCDMLEKSFEELMREVETHEDEWLEHSVPGEAYNFDYLLHGIFQHDIYHLGQIRGTWKYFERKGATLA